MKKKCVIFIGTIFLVWTVSCAQSPTTVPLAALLTSTPHFESVTPTVTDFPTITPTAKPTVTPSLTDTPTIPPTATHTSTASPTKTSTPTFTPRPQKIIFSDDFNGRKTGLFTWDGFGKGQPDKWAGWHSDGVSMDIVTDPTNSLDNSGKPRGNVLKITIRGDPVQFPFGPSSDPRWWRAGYPTWHNGETVQILRAPCGIQVDIFKPTDWMNLGALSVHRLNKKTGDTISVAGIGIYKNTDIPQLLVRDGNGKDTYVWLRTDLFRIGQWNTLRMDFWTDGSVIPFINGQNAYVDPNNLLKVPVDADHDAGFSDGHAGWQAANQDKNDGYTNGQYLLNDNFVVYEYQ